jgi:hypothetical protein
MKVITKVDSYWADKSCRKSQEQQLQKERKKRQDGLLDLRLGSAGRCSRLWALEGEDLLRVGLGVLHQSFPLLLVHPCGITSLRPVDVLLPVGNQSDGPLDSDLQIIPPIGQHRIFLTKKTLNKLRKNLRLRLLGKEMGEEALECGSGIGNIGVRQISLQLED